MDIILVSLQCHQTNNALKLQIMKTKSIENRIKSVLKPLCCSVNVSINERCVRVYPKDGVITSVELEVISRIEYLYFVSCVFEPTNIYALFKIVDSKD